MFKNKLIYFLEELVSYKPKFHWNKYLYKFSDAKDKKKLNIYYKGHGSINLENLPHLLSKIKKKKINPNTPDKFGEILLNYVITYYKNLSCSLIDLLENVDTPNSKGVTPLLLAVWRQDYPVVDKLLARGVNANHQTNEGEGVFSNCGAFLTSSQNLKKLINAGASVHTQDKDGNTPLMFSVKKDQTMDNKEHCKIDFFIQNGADINHQNNDGLTPLMMAVQCSHTDDVIKLLKYNPDLNLKNKEGKTALEIAPYFYVDFNSQIRLEIYQDIQMHAIKVKMLNDKPSHELNIL